MSLLFMDGFDNYSFIPLKWGEHNLLDYAYISSSASRKSYGQGLKFTRNYYSSSLHMGLILEEVQEELIVGFAFKKIYSDTGYLELAFNDGATKQAYIRLFDTNIVYNVGSDSSLEGSLGSLKYNEWNYVETRIKFHSSAGTITVKSNENTVIDVSGIPTIVNSNNYVDRIRFRVYPQASTSVDYVYIDDLYVCNTSGTVNNTFLGNCEIKTLYTDSAGTNTEFEVSTASSGTPNYTVVSGTHVNDDTIYTNTFYEYDSADDGEYWNNTGFNNTDTTTVNFDINGYEQGLYLRFSGVTIPKFAEIISAYIQVVVEYRYTSSSYDFTNYAGFQDTGTPAAQVTGYSDANGRALTPYTQAFTFRYTDPTTINFKDSLQYLVNKDNWQEENNVVLWKVHQYYSGGGGSSLERWRIRTYDYSNDPLSSNSPRLYVQWKLPGGDSGNYVYSVTQDAKDSYNFQDTSGISTIHCIKQSTFAKMAYDRSNPNIPNLANLVVISGSVYMNNTGVRDDLQYKEAPSLWELNPHTSLPWTLTDLNALEAGMTTISG